MTTKKAAFTVGALLARHAAEVELVDQLVVVAIYGYDFGIASGSQPLSPQASDNCGLKA